MSHCVTGFARDAANAKRGVLQTATRLHHPPDFCILIYCPSKSTFSVNRENYPTVRWRAAWKSVSWVVKLERELKELVFFQGLVAATMMEAWARVNAEERHGADGSRKRRQHRSLEERTFSYRCMVPEWNSSFWCDDSAFWTSCAEKETTWILVKYQVQYILIGSWTF